MFEWGTDHTFYGLRELLRFFTEGWYFFDLPDLRSESFGMPEPLREAEARGVPTDRLLKILKWIIFIFLYIVI